jgi:integrase
MRIEEICQLYIEDFKQHEDIWYFDLNNKREDNSIKNKERRLVPLHPFLTKDLNFVGYVKGLPNQQGRIFPELTRTGNRYSSYPLVWFSQFKARCGIVADKGSKASHAFRHTIATHLAEQDVPTLWKAILIGHARKGETEGTYTHADDSKIIYEKTVAKIDYGLDLSHLKGGRFACPIR